VAAVLEQLDYIYAPSSDVARDLASFAELPGARVAFAIEDGGTRVAMLQLTESSPRLLLADHLEGETPVYIYRVPSLAEASGRLRAGGWEELRTLEIPVGPCASFRAPGGQRLALYERTRPGVVDHFEGRRDF